MKINLSLVVLALLLLLLSFACGGGDDGENVDGDESGGDGELADGDAEDSDGDTEADADGDGELSESDGDAEADSAGESDIEEEPARRLVDYVNPFMGTGGPGFMVGSSTPAATAPFGMVKVGPDTTGENGAPSFYHCSGYYYEDPIISVFHIRTCTARAYPTMDTSCSSLWWAST